MRVPSPVMDAETRTKAMTATAEPTHTTPNSTPPSRARREGRKDEHLRRERMDLRVAGPQGPARLHEAGARGHHRQLERRMASGHAGRHVPRARPARLERGAHAARAA